MCTSPNIRRLPVVSKMIKLSFQVVYLLIDETTMYMPNYKVFQCMS